MMCLKALGKGKQHLKTVDGRDIQNQEGKINKNEIKNINNQLDEELGL